MNNILAIVIFISGLISCSKQNQNLVEQKINKDNNELIISDNKNQTLKNWIDFYKKTNPNFSTKNFKFKTKTTLNKMDGNVDGNFDENFDKIYENFLVYSHDKSKYIDFDSYQWNIEKDDKTKVQFEVDQEVNLVNIPNKTVERIAFFGSSIWVENAFWENDNIIFLLENGSDKIPRIDKINLEDNTISTFEYNNTLKTKSKYPEERISKILNKN